MSGEEQQSAVATNADVMSELTGADIDNQDAAERRNSMEQASVIAQAGDAGQKGATAPGVTQQGTKSSNPSETPAVRPPTVGGAASPVKPAPGSPVVASSSLQGHARQDLNDKLDNLAPDASVGSGATNVQSISSLDGKENARSETTGHLNGTAVPANLHTDVLKEQTPASSVATQQNQSAGQAAGPAPRKISDELPEGIKALRNKFLKPQDSITSSSSQPVPLPKETAPRASPVSLEVQHKPGSKQFTYKELTELRLEDGIDPTCKEEYLTDEEFTEVFKKWSPDRAHFKKQPLWRQRVQKQAVGLF